jgi:hypothetical protein
MANLGWTSCRADQDLWMKSETRSDDGVQYCAYILIYVDGILCVHHDYGLPLTKMEQYFKINNESIHEPTFYLGEKLKKTTLSNGGIAWGMSSSKYLQSDVHNVKDYLTVSAGGQTLKKRASAPFPLD